MPKDFADLQEKVDLVYKHVKTIHVDVMNGTVTHHVNWPFSPEMEEEFHEITAGKKALPHWKEVDFEVDVMMQDPEDSLAEWVNAGFHRIVVHVESTKKFQKILNEWKGVVEIGAAIGTNTDVRELEQPIRDGADFVQFMGISEIGFQGSPFDKSVLGRIETFHAAHPNMVIVADGGVSKITAPFLLRAGVVRLVAGSAIFNPQKGGVSRAEGNDFTNRGDLVDLTDYESEHSDDIYVTAINEFNDMAKKINAIKQQT